MVFETAVFSVACAATDVLVEPRGMVMFMPASGRPMLVTAERNGRPDSRFGANSWVRYWGTTRPPNTPLVER